MKRMTHPVAIVAAIIFSTAAVQTANAQQDSKELLKQAYELVERGRNDEALAKLNEVLAKDPSAEDA